jgi:serine/threonine protein kinase
LSLFTPSDSFDVPQAAISSTLSHPNIVATYTYSIKPVRDTTAGVKAKKPSQVVPGVLVADADGSIADAKPAAAAPAPQKAAIHSYEVRLILEFCDRGCLREALESQSFLDASLGGLNYAAILDTALDVAKAMCHLHASNVLHGDLKARNVMLKVSGDGRGFVAKVAGESSVPSRDAILTTAQRPPDRNPYFSSCGLQTLASQSAWNTKRPL